MAQTMYVHMNKQIKKTKSFYIAKETINRIKRHPAE
jgi:hypothetical protein